MLTIYVQILAKGQDGPGHIWTYVRYGRPFWERTLPEELHYASRARRHEHPSSIFQTLQAEAYDEVQGSLRAVPALRARLSNDELVLNALWTSMS
jgi:hypothetical protein